jgi:hypothetical protein
MAKSGYPDRQSWKVGPLKKPKNMIAVANPPGIALVDNGEVEIVITEVTVVEIATIAPGIVAVRTDTKIKF